MAKQKQPPAKKGASKNVSRETLNPLQEIGESFLLARTRQKMQVQELEQASGVSKPTLSKLEKGELENTSTETLRKIANALGLTLTITVE